MALDETNPRPGDTEPELLRKILTLLGGKASPGDTTEKITAKIILALSAALATVPAASGPTKAYVDSGDAASVTSANAFASAGDAATLTSANAHSDAADALHVLKTGDTVSGTLSVNILSAVSGANERAGTIALTGATTAVANTTVTANTIVLLSRKTAIGTPGTAVGYTTTPGVGFTITAIPTDTSIFTYFLVEAP